MFPTTARHVAILATLLVALTAGGRELLAQTIDPHEVYEGRCAGCHEAHAADFVRDGLRRDAGVIVGRKSGEPLRAFLSAGHGRLKPAEIDPIVVHLSAILDSGGLFRRKCTICHGRAVELARSELIVLNGRLIGRYTGRDIASFMEDHGRLEPQEVPTILRMLERQLTTRAKP